MNRWKTISVISMAVAGVCAAALGFVLAKGQQGPKWEEIVVMHAEILERDGAFFHVNGLDCNDVNGQGECTFSVTEDTVLEWRYTPIALEDFKAGDKVSVTYTGPVMLSEPAQLTQVLRIQLLEDEK